MADDPTQQLEGVAAQAPGQLGQALQNQQNQPAPAAPAAPDPVADGLDQAAQHYSQQLQENATRPAQGGAIKRLLSNFIGGMGQSMMQEAGLPTPYEKQQQAIQGLQGVAAAKAHLATVQSLQAQSAPVPLIGIDDQPVTGSDGKPIMLPANHAATIYAARIAAQGRENVAQTGAQSKVQVANIQQGGGLQLPVSQSTAELAGAPELTGQSLGMGGWKMLNSALRARGFHVQDTGTSGPDGGLWVVDSGGNKVNQVSPTSLVQSRGESNARARAEYTPFETVEPGTNTPMTISNLQAVRTGAPKVPLGTQIKLGGQYSLFNDAYGLLGKIDNMVGSGDGQVNLDNSSVRARVTAGYAALKDPASKGISGEFLSNYLARQPVYNSMTPQERELVLTMAQGKAAATGLRGILGQAGSNEMQQRLDSGLFPGGQNLGNAASVKQQTSAVRGLLDRVAVGQPQVGLNAPNTPTSLANKQTNAANLTPPKAADPGMKWQHRMNNGNVEWRQVPR